VIRTSMWPDAWFDFDGMLDFLCDHPDITRVCEVGAGANPVIPPEVIAARGLSHTILDISQDELEKAPPQYEKIRADITEPSLAVGGNFDLVASAFVAEHVRSPRTFHRNIWNMLRPGGVALHLFPTLYTLPFAFNRTMPAVITERLLLRMQSFRHPEGRHGKFKAHYRWCRGPTRRQLARLEGMGFSVVAYTGYFGHGYYLNLGRLHRFEQAKARGLIRRRAMNLTSYALVLLQRPPSAAMALAPVPARPRSEVVRSSVTQLLHDRGWS
jgi:2-polyprenyl-3-methyl-5-hydroxy-6-metoxy-1,4-benzoquinol methylase